MAKKVRTPLLEAEKDPCAWVGVKVPPAPPAPPPLVEELTREGELEVVGVPAAPPAPPAPPGVGVPTLEGDRENGGVVVGVTSRGVSVGSNGVPLPPRKSLKVGT